MTRWSRYAPTCRRCSHRNAGQFQARFLGAIHRDLVTGVGVAHDASGGAVTKRAILFHIIEYPVAAILNSYRRLLIWGERTLLDDDLRNRVRRLISGDCRSGDLDRLFLGLRERNYGYSCFREIGDFVAHRATRTKGLITEVGRDVFTSVDVWSLKIRGMNPSQVDIIRAANANLRLATDEQLKSGCGCRRQIAQSRLKSALQKMDRDETPTDAEFRVLHYVGNRFIWRPAFTSDRLYEEFRQVLSENKIVAVSDVGILDNIKSFLSLYALSLMHGSSIELENGHRAKLYAGFANRERNLEVKIEIVFEELGKPLMTPICLFLTDMKPDDYCDSELCGPETPRMADHWKFPIDINAAGKLCRSF